MDDYTIKVDKLDGEDLEFLTDFPGILPKLSQLIVDGIILSGDKVSVTNNQTGKVYM